MKGEGGMKKYIGTKVIHAEPATQGDFRYTKAVAVDPETAKHDGDNTPGYMVIYEDGYVSWSPKDVFEAAYRPSDGCPFGMALEAVKKGNGMRLPQWAPDVTIRAQFPDEHSKMTAPYLYVESRFGRVPWKETMIELFSDNWQIVE